ncbi:class I SAM-dependent methyltransferase [Streptomyces sp. NPDC006487]|uniref:class I SAM-dependent methyltransferase n=1 Tax=Streptomyces sp. NPDC006487 TaxID=3364748 RepID=UPI0036BE45F2
MTRRSATPPTPAAPAQLAESFRTLLRSPSTGGELHWAEPYVLTDGESLWPCLEGIPYLRLGRDSLRAAAVAAIRAGDLPGALAMLLCDRKDDTIPPADPAAVRALVDGAGTAAEAMAALGYGGLAPYFLHRWCQPTYLSGLALLEEHAPAGGTLFEVGCGAGHFLRTWLERSGPAIGSDLVFSHLWLARVFVAPQAHLVCFDAEGSFPIADGSAEVALSHDSFHYFRDKKHVLDELLRIGGTGPVLLGHVHNASHDNFSAGLPLPTDGYTATVDPDLCYDDAALTTAALDGRAASPQSAEGLREVAALAFACRTTGSPAAPGKPTDPVPGRLTGPLPGRPLTVNPLLGDDGPRWPDEKFAREFTDGWSYLRDLARPDEATVTAARAGLVGRDPEVARLAARRVFLDLPESWI